MKIHISYSVTFGIDTEVDDKFKKLKYGENSPLMQEFLDEVYNAIDNDHKEFGDVSLDGVWNDDNKTICLGE